MTHLSDQQIKFYNEKGYVAPINVLSIQEANEIRQEIEIIEKKWPNALEGIGVGGKDGQMVGNWIAYHLKTTLNWGLCASLGAILLAMMTVLYWA